MALYCVVTTSMGGITDWQKIFPQLVNKVNVQEYEIKSLHQMMNSSLSALYGTLYLCNDGVPTFTL